MNGDGLDDLIVGEYNGYLNMFTRKADNTLNTGVRLRTQSGEIKNPAKWEKGTYPEITDWNNDGLKDMVVAFHHYNDPRDTARCVSLFLNVGTETTPLFEDKGFILAGGEPINQFWFQCPQVVDLNMDGKKDLIVASSGWESEPDQTLPGYVWYYENTGPDDAPELEAGVKLMLKNGTAIQDTGLKNLNNFCVCHWDDDGVWDMLVVHEDWENPGELRGEPQKPTIRILKGHVETAVAGKKIKQNSGLPSLSIGNNNRITLRNYSEMNLVIYSIDGREIGKYRYGEYSEQSLRKTIGILSPGMYIYNFSKDSKRISTGIFITY